MLRLTCKVLEHLTYDLFSKTFFERRYCCIYYETRWLLMKAVISSRLGGRVREVTFTQQPLECKRYEDLQLAPNASQTDLRTAQIIAERDLSRSVSIQAQVPAWPSTAVFSRTFRDLKRLTPNTLIKFDFLKGWFPQTNYTGPLVKFNVLVAAVSAAVSIDTLKLEVEDTHLLKDVLVHLESELTASTKTLTCFQLEAFRTQRNDYDTQFVTTILDSANDLRELITMGPPGRQATTTKVTTAILRECDFTRLTTLHIMGFEFAVEELVAGLGVSRSMLHVYLSDVRLSSSEQSWPSIFRALASLPKLHKLSLLVLRYQSFSYRRLAFRSLTHGRTSHEGKMIEYEGKEQTAAGLEELAAAPLASECDAQNYLLVHKETGYCRICGHVAALINEHEHVLL